MAHEFDDRKYEGASVHQKQWGARLIAELNLWGSERVLDLGSQGMIESANRDDGTCFETFRRINVTAQKTS